MDANDVPTNNNVGPQGDRARTEKVIAQAVLRVLDRSSLLAGFSITDVVNEAQVDRGLIYQYFGNRRELVRTALRAGIEERYTYFTKSADGMPVEERWGDYLDSIVLSAEAIQLVTTLFLDQDPQVKLMPLKQRTIPAMKNDQRAGYLAPDITVEGALVAISSLGYGYALFRDGWAEEVGIDPRELDLQVQDVFKKFLRALSTTDDKTD